MEVGQQYLEYQSLGVVRIPDQTRIALLNNPGMVDFALRAVESRQAKSSFAALRLMGPHDQHQPDNTHQNVEFLAGR